MRALKVALVVTFVAFIGALVNWPRISDVETGKTPEYPDLVPKMYATGEAKVAKAAEEAIARLSRFRLVGAGSGAGGRSIQAVATSPLLPFEHDVTIRIRRVGAWTQVTARSKSRVGSFDFGQNARNIRAFLAELDRALS